MPIREITGVNDGSALFPDFTSSTVTNNSATSSVVNTKTSQDVKDAQGFIGYVTNYYNFDGSNPVQSVVADTWTDLQPTVQTLFDERTDSMKSGSTEGYLPATHGEHGHGTHGAYHSKHTQHLSLIHI